MKKEIKSIHCEGGYPYHTFSWEGSIVIYDNIYFEGIVKELSFDSCSVEEHPEEFIAGYIVDNQVITFDKFPEATTPYDDIAFLSKYYNPKYSTCDNSHSRGFARGSFAPIMPCGNCPSFYKSLYYNKDNGLDIDLFDKIKNLFPCEDDEIILLDEKRKNKIPKGAFYTSPLNSELEYTVNATLNGDDMGWFGLHIDNKEIIKKPEDIIIDEQELEQKIEAFKNNMREFDMYLYKNISENKEEKYNRILERLVKNGHIEEQSPDENYSDEEQSQYKNYSNEKKQETESHKKGLQKIKDRFKRVFKK